MKPSSSSDDHHHSMSHLMHRLREMRERQRRESAHKDHLAEVEDHSHDPRNWRTAPQQLLLKSLERDPARKSLPLPGSSLGQRLRRTCDSLAAWNRRSF